MATKAKDTDFKFLMDEYQGGALDEMFSYLRELCSGDSRKIRKALTSKGVKENLVNILAKPGSGKLQTMSVLENIYEILLDHDLVPSTDHRDYYKIYEALICSGFPIDSIVFLLGKNASTEVQNEIIRLYMDGLKAAQDKKMVDETSAIGTKFQAVWQNIKRPKTDLDATLRRDVSNFMCKRAVTLDGIAIIMVNLGTATLCINEKLNYSLINLPNEDLVWWNGTILNYILICVINELDMGYLNMRIEHHYKSAVSDHESREIDMVELVSLRRDEICIDITCLSTAAMDMFNLDR